MKKIWLSAVNSTKEEVQKTQSVLQQYGIAVEGHFWLDDLDKMAWAAPRQAILDAKINMWAIIVGKEDLASPTLRYGLALLALTVQAAKGQDFPIVILKKSSEAIPSDNLPTSLSGCDILELNNTAYGAKIVAKLHKPITHTIPPYRLDVYGIPQIGQWFEVGPRDGTWSGALFGTSGTQPCLHIVGKAGQLPEKSVLNFPQQGLEIDLVGRKFTAWAVQNQLDSASSYYVKVDGHPDSILFSAYSMNETAEVFVIKLK